MSLMGKWMDAVFSLPLVQMEDKNKINPHKKILQGAQINMKKKYL